jgi:uncharacterized protein (TIGR02145 family)
MKSPFILLLILTVFLFNFGCPTEEEAGDRIEISTSDISAITNSTAYSGGIISSDGGDAITQRGVCWSIYEYPTIGNPHTKDGNGTGSFSSELTELEAVTEYYVRAYAINRYSTVYGNQIVFSTGVAPATIKGTKILELKAKSAKMEGTVSEEGGGTVTEKGACWSTSLNPTVDDHKVNSGSGSGKISAEITGLVPDTQYFFRLYATNEAGTAYGEEMSFTTKDGVPELHTKPVFYLTNSEALGGGMIIDDGGLEITEKGVCWSTSENPTTADSKTSDGNGSGNFESNISGLTPQTLYFVRCYISSDLGVFYGHQVKCTSPVEDVEGNSYQVVGIGDQLWMAENLKTKKYNDGSALDYLPDSAAWANAIAAAFSYSLSQQDEGYGPYYNMFAITSGRLCPTGWHVPSDSEIDELISVLGDVADIGDLLKSEKEEDWNSPHTDATNASGFTGLPGGIRTFNSARFAIGREGFWWTATGVNTSEGSYFSLKHDSSALLRGEYDKRTGMSVRCVKD